MSHWTRVGSEITSHRGLVVCCLLTCGVPLLGGEDLLEGEDLLLRLLELGLPLLPLPLLLLRTQLLEVPADHRVSGGVDVLKWGD